MNLLLGIRIVYDLLPQMGSCSKSHFHIAGYGFIQCRETVDRLGSEGVRNMAGEPGEIPQGLSILARPLVVFEWR